MNKDTVLEAITSKVSDETKVNQLEVERAINLTFKGLHSFMTSDDTKRVKIPYFGTFRLKNNLKNGNTQVDNSGE